MGKNQRLTSSATTANFTDAFARKKNPRTNWEEMGLAKPRQGSRTSSARKPQENTEDAPHEKNKHEHDGDRTNARVQPRSLVECTHFISVVKVGMVRLETKTATTDV